MSILVLKHTLGMKQHQIENLDNYIQRFKAARDMLLQQWDGQLVFDKQYLKKQINGYDELETDLDVIQG